MLRPGQDVVQMYGESIRAEDDAGDAIYFHAGALSIARGGIAALRRCVRTAPQAGNDVRAVIETVLARARLTNYPMMTIMTILTN
jgi:hypothetical protein